MLRRASPSDNKQVEVHPEDNILAPWTAHLLDKEPSEFDLTEPSDKRAIQARRSLGQVAEGSDLQEPRPDKLDNI